VKTTFYVVDSKSPALLSLQTSIDLEFIKLTFAVDKQGVELSKQTILSEYNDLFKGIGLFPGTCSLHLKENAVPVVCPPRQVLVALQDKLKMVGKMHYYKGYRTD
jgi:hypothetical protein